MKGDISAEDGRERVRRLMGLAPNQRAVRVPGGPACELLADLASLQRDFEMARQFLRHFAELAQDEVEPDSPNQSFWISALTMYGRAFAKGRRHAARATPDIYDDSDLEAHRFLIDIRNKFIAHSANAFEQAAIFAIIADSSDGGFTVQGAGSQHSSFARLSRKRALQVSKMCEVQLADIDARMATARNAVMAEVRDLGEERISRLPELGMVRIDESAVGRDRPQYR
ncbi:hypothetical protein ACFUTX_05155 [Microbacterium sp. NPDC057407]|uniref:hypothetical protein n=1 Tax=Microbacterium sp. NPDC057407 TaxID=3346120 RepID=UPI00366F7FD5